ncbi:MAG: aminotransferase class V-fold PLP-dependent enzyme [Gammaproteobacteria bacterium]|nr:aminotransferase class V-fold PLP-dependent enzyme [Gammaproteobacteria bacterium]
MNNSDNFKHNFHLTDGSYLLNHSVGRPLKSTQQVINDDFLAPWQQTNKEPWQQWLQTIDKFTHGLANLFNSKAELFCPQSNLSSALTKLLMSLPQLNTSNKGIKKAKILMSEIDFPSMGFVAQNALNNHVEIVYLPQELSVTEINHWQKYLTKEIDLVFISHVYSNTGQQAPLKQLVELAKQNSTLSVVDVAQSAGILPLDLTDLAPDFMIGSSVKWLCGSSGAAYLWLNEQHIETCQPKDVGWFSHQNPFEFNIHHFDYHKSALRFWGGTPTILPYTVAANSIKYFADKVELVRKHNVKLQNHIIEQLPEFIASPFDVRQRSGTVILNLVDNQKAIAALTKNNIAVDLRECGIRVSPHIYNDENDIERLAEVVRKHVS